MSSSSRKHALCLPLVAAVLFPACDAQVDPDYPGEPIAQVRGSVVAQDGAPSESAVAILWFTSSADLQCEGPVQSCGYGVGGDNSTDFECLEACGEPAGCSEEVLEPWAACIEDCGALDVSYDITWEPCANGAVGAQVAIEGSFPASFQLDLFDPPPPEALLPTAEGVELAFGWIVAVEGDAPLQFDFTSEQEVDRILGAAPHHVLVYAGTDVPADSPWGAYLGGSFSPGYHVVEALGGEVECEPGGPEGPETCAQELSTFQPAPDDLETEIELEFGPLWKIGVPL